MSDSYQELLDFVAKSCGGEAILGIVFGDCRDLLCTSQSEIPFQHWEVIPEPGKFYSIEDARPFLVDFSFEDGPSFVPAINAWTENCVIVVVLYDDSTWLASVPRHPVEHVPFMIGGG